MKIVQLLPALNEGGVERGTVELNRELVKLGFESVVISSGGKQAVQIEQDGGRHIVFDVASKNPLSVPMRVYRLKKLLQKIRPDVIHARSRVPAWLSFWANKSLGIPFVTTVHGFNSVNAYSAIMTKSDTVICVSEAIRHHIVKHYNTPIGKTVVIPRGVDTQRFDPNNVDKGFIRDFTKRYDLDEKVVVSIVGRITQLKDLETFIDAAALCAKRDDNFRALIVGGADESKRDYLRQLQARVAHLGLSETVYFVGSQRNVAEIYALSDAVVSSSKKPESFGRSVAEAIAMNTPVVATGHGGVLDIVQEGINGYLYDVGDAQGLCDAIYRAIPLHFDGYGYIRNRFSLDKMVYKTIEVYKRWV